MSTDRKWQSLRDHLESQKKSIAEEIRNYPPPIPACDAQFNHLAERRRLVSRELARLARAARGDTGAVDDFVASSPLRSELSVLVRE